MGNVNFNSVRNKIKNSKKIEQIVNKKINTQFEAIAENFIRDFENHPITQEIKSGPAASNSSGTLGGVGNLFSFIGFNSGSNPIQKVTEYIKRSIKIKKESISIRNSKIKIDYKINYPNIQELSSITPMPWEGGNSWLLGIEKGISGFSNYMYKIFNKSRSGTGLQTDNKIRSGSFKPTKYMSSIINNFINSVNKIKIK